MFPDNLTRAEAQARSALIQTRAYRVEVDLAGQRGEHRETTFVSSSTVRFTARGAGAVHVDLIADRVLDAALDGVDLDPATFAASRLPFDVGPGEHELTVTAVCRFSRSGQGLHHFVDPADGRTYLYTQFEPADARRMYACFEQPDLKGRFTLSVTAPASWTVVSCAPELAVTPLVDGLARWDFAETLPISTYLTALVAGEYHRERQIAEAAAGPLELGLLCRRSLAEHLDADRLLATSTAGFRVFEEQFGYPYPFAKYDQVFVPEYNAGAMENVGCVTLRDEYLFRGRVTSASYQLRDDTVLHELSHMWFGDLVTMTWWDDLWLKESFATWASHFAVGEIGDPAAAWAAFCSGMKTWAYRQDQLPSTHPIAADMIDLEAVELNFDGITYAKGASVLVQLVAFVGRDSFVSGLRDYFAKHAFGNTELSDLLRALEQTSGRDLAEWSAQWLETAGVNTLRARFAVDHRGRFASFAVEQSAEPAWPTLRSHRVAIGLYRLTPEGLQRTERVETDVAGRTTVIPELVGRRQPDLIMINDDDLTYAKVRLDPRSLSTVVNQIHTVPSVLTRAVCWGAAWDMCRDAELPAQSYVQLALRGIGVESDLTAVNAVLGAGLKAAADYTGIAERSGVLQDWQDGLEGLLALAPAGSDHQLALAKGYAAAANDTEAADRLAGWLTGSRVPDGLVIDPDLRWLLVNNLARLGRLDEADIAAELAADNTITGAEQAAGARAARPTAQAKADAWRDAVEEDRIPATTQRMICRAFWQRGQDAVLQPYAERYFAAVEDISAGRGAWSAKGAVLRTTVLRDLFPQPRDLVGFLSQLDAWLAGRELADYVRRVIAESRDDTVRAVRCQSAG